MVSSCGRVTHNPNLQVDLAMNAPGSHMSRHWGAVSRLIRAGHYQPNAVRGVEIPKSTCFSVGIPHQFFAKQSVCFVVSKKLVPSKSKPNFPMVSD